MKKSGWDPKRKARNEPGGDEGTEAEPTGEKGGGQNEPNRQEAEPGERKSGTGEKNRARPEEPGQAGRTGPGEYSRSPIQKHGG